MAIVCPAILAANSASYHQEIERIGALVDRIQIDLTDGQFAQAPTIDPADAWWPIGVKADFHLMYEEPLPAVKTILHHKANLIIVHAEAKGSFEEVAHYCRQAGVKTGVALLAQTPAAEIEPALASIDHVLIFSGNLGSYGGHSDLSLLDKVKTLKSLKPELEIGWDGGVNDQNIRALVDGGVDVLNVGGFIQKAQNPRAALAALQAAAR